MLSVLNLPLPIHWQGNDTCIDGLFRLLLSIYTTHWSMASSQYPNTSKEKWITLFRRTIGANIKEYYGCPSDNPVKVFDNINIFTFIFIIMIWWLFYYHFQHGRACWIMRLYKLWYATRIRYHIPGPPQYKNGLSMHDYFHCRDKTYLHNGSS